MTLRLDTLRTMFAEGGLFYFSGLSLDITLDLSIVNKLASTPSFEISDQVMQLETYKINSKHRMEPPTEHASIWLVERWEELQLFSIAFQKGWKTEDKDILWAITIESTKLKQIGKGWQHNKKIKALYIAKYVSDSSHPSDWHGYPVEPKDDADIPPDTVLDLWHKDKLIDKHDRRHIQQGKF